jgi:hypothetical protein
MPRKKKKTKKPTLAWKRRSARSYAGEVGIPYSRAYKKLFGK